MASVVAHCAQCRRNFASIAAVIFARKGERIFTAVIAPKRKRYIANARVLRAVDDKRCPATSSVLTGVKAFAS
jgi:hypothetical protein